MFLYGFDWYYMVNIQTVFSDKQNQKIGIVKIIKKLSSKQDSVRLMVDEYDIDELLKEVSE